MRLRISVAVDRRARAGRPLRRSRPQPQARSDLKRPQRPPRAAFARSMLQIRFMASTREMSSRAYSCRVKMKLAGPAREYYPLQHEPASATLTNTQGRCSHSRLP